MRRVLVDFSDIDDGGNLTWTLGDEDAPLKRGAMVTLYDGVGNTAVGRVLIREGSVAHFDVTEFQSRKR
jgi:hypothetical protein